MFILLAKTNPCRAVPYKSNDDSFTIGGMLSSAYVYDLPSPITSTAPLPFPQCFPYFCGSHISHRAQDIRCSGHFDTSRRLPPALQQLGAPPVAPTKHPIAPCCLDGPECNERRIIPLPLGPPERYENCSTPVLSAARLAPTSGYKRHLIACSTPFLGSIPLQHHMRL